MQCESVLYAEVVGMDSNQDEDILNLLGVNFDLFLLLPYGVPRVESLSGKFLRRLTKIDLKK